MYDIYVLSFIIIIVIHHNHCYMSLSLPQITFTQDIKKKNNALHTTFFQTNNKTKIINTKASNEDFLKYSILLSLHYYDITYHPERISKIKPFENNISFHIILLMILKKIILLFHREYMMKIMK